MFDALKTALEDTIDNVPYNSFGKGILASGGEYPPEFGGNCVFQNHELLLRLEAGGIPRTEIAFTTAQERPHWVTLVKDGASLWYLDPFLLCPTPIDINEVRRNGEPSHFSAYPKVSENTGLVEVSQLQNGVRFRLFRPTMDGGRKRVLNYTYGLEEDELKTELPGVDYQVLAGLAQKVLTYSAFFRDRSQTMIRVSPETGKQSFFEVGRAWAFTREDQPERAEAILDRIAQERGQTRAALEKFIEDGLAAYRKLRNTGAGTEEPCVE